MTLTDPADYDHCARGCGRLLQHFDRTVARQRCEPQVCWTCKRKEEPPQVAMHRRIVARQPTVVHLAPEGGAA